MEPCNNINIPARLHSNGKLPIEEFYIGEYLYRHCLKDKINDPFDGISLRDLSVNRQGNPENPISERDDVLLSPNFDDAGQINAVIPFKIMELNEEKKYYKIIEVVGMDGQNNPMTLSCSIVLKHDMLPCNYSHTVFQFYYEDILVNEDNYRETLGKSGKKYSKLRSTCKFEIYKMMVKKEIWINWPTDDISTE